MKKRCRHKSPGKPVAHPKVKHIESGKIFDTYKEAAEYIGGNRWGVRYTAMGIQSNHFGNHFEYVKSKNK